MIGAVDIGGTQIAVGVVDSDGKILAHSEGPADPPNGFFPTLWKNTQNIRTSAKMANATNSRIGIGSTGPVYPLTSEIGNVNFFPKWEGENPVKDLTEIFAVKVAIENDADAAALGEAGWGAGKDKNRLVYVTVGTGIGTGLIFDGQ